MDKFHGKTDDELVILFKNGKEDAETELIQRYKYHAFKLSKNIYNQFKSSINCDAEDLYNVALLAVFTAAKSFSKKRGFRSYWSMIARNDVMSLVKTNSNSYNKNVIPIADFDSSEEYLAFAENDTKNDILYDEIIRIINKPELKIDDLSKELFALYLCDYSIAELAKKYNLSYHAVSYRIEAVREKLHKKIIHS